MEELIKYIPLLIPLAVIQLGFMIFVIVDIARKKQTKNLTPLIWIIAAVFFNSLCIGSVLYLIYGRAEKTYDDNDDI